MRNTNSSSRTTAAIQASLKKRYARERRFQWYGRLAVMTGFVFLFILLADIVGKGYPAFTQHYIKVTLNLDPDRLDVGPHQLRQLIDEFLTCRILRRRIAGCVRSELR